jgi:hypothetical protein
MDDVTLANHIRMTSIAVARTAKAGFNSSAVVIASIGAGPGTEVSRPSVKTVGRSRSIFLN